MRRGTTPLITLTVPMDLRGWSVYITLKNGVKQLTFENDMVSVDYADGISTLRFVLTQEQTLSFKVGECEIQLRAAKDGSAVASSIGTVKIERIIMDGVIDG